MATKYVKLTPCKCLDSEPWSTSSGDEVGSPGDPVYYSFDDTNTSSVHISSGGAPNANIVNQSGGLSDLNAIAISSGDVLGVPSEGENQILLDDNTYGGCEIVDILDSLPSGASASSSWDGRYYHKNSGTSAECEWYILGFMACDCDGTSTGETIDYKSRGGNPGTGSSFQSGGTCFVQVSAQKQSGGGYGSDTSPCVEEGDSSCLSLSDQTGCGNCNDEFALCDDGDVSGDPVVNTLDGATYSLASKKKNK